MKTLKLAKKERSLTKQTIDLYAENKVEYTGETPDEAFQRVLDEQRKDIMDAFEIGLEYYHMVKPKLNNIHGNDNTRYYLITCRPPYDTKFDTFKFDVEKYINQWKGKWEWYEYAYEQIGENTDNLGKGFHIHLIAATTTENYYPSHIIRDCTKAFPYINKNCIQIDKIRNLPRAKEYIRGIKDNPDKEPGVAMNSIWRQNMKLQDIYSNADGQVRPSALVEFI